LGVRKKVPIRVIRTPVAYNGTVDLVYYGTTASSDPTAVWNTYLAQTTNDGASFRQSLASNTPNHVGVVCTHGIACGFGTRNLLDLFKVAIDPNTGRAAVIYTDDTITKESSRGAATSNRSRAAGIVFACTLGNQLRLCP
jgi:hypothetical protein